MGKPISFLGWLLSFAGACLGTLLALTAWDRVNGALEYVLWSGALFLAAFLGGFLGLQLSLLLNRRYRVQRAPRWLAAFLLSGVLIFGVGAGGQALFMLSAGDVAVSSSVDMVVLLDASGSMDTSGYQGPRTEAATQFIDALTPDHRLQAVSFAATVLDSTQLLPVDEGGKKTLKAFVASIDSVGMTDFNAPLLYAMDTLSEQTREDSNQAILLLTDGEGILDPQVVDTLLASGIRVFSVRIDASLTPSREAQALAELAERTGGFDTQLKPSAEGGVDTAAMLDAFQNAFQASTEREIRMDEVLLISSEETTVYQFVVRLVTLVLCAMLFGVGYFAQIDRRGIPFNLSSGVVLAVLISLAGGAILLCLFLICLLMAAAYVRLEWNGGGTLNV